MLANMWASVICRLMGFLMCVYTAEYWSSCTDAEPDETWHPYSCITLLCFIVCLLCFWCQLTFKYYFKSFCQALLSDGLTTMWRLLSLRFSHFFVTGFHCIALAGPEHTMLTRLASDSQWSTWRHCLPSARITGVHHHTWLSQSFGLVSCYAAQHQVQISLCQHHPHGSGWKPIPGQLTSCTRLHLYEVFYIGWGLT